MDEKRFIELLDERLNKVFDERMASFEKRLTSLEERMTSLEKRMDSLEKRMTSLEKRMDSLEKRMDSFEQRLTSLENTVTKMETDFGDKLKALLDYQLINDEKHEEYIVETQNIRETLARHLVNLAAEIRENSATYIADEKAVKKEQP